MEVYTLVYSSSWLHLWQNFCNSVYVNLKPGAWGWPEAAPLYADSLSSVYHKIHNTYGSILLVNRKLPLIRWPSLEMHIIGTERRAQGWPTCWRFDMDTKPQLNLRSTWVFCAVILWNSSLCSQAHVCRAPELLPELYLKACAGPSAPPSRGWSRSGSGSSLAPPPRRLSPPWSSSSFSAPLPKQPGDQQGQSCM